nr:MerR family transcriptional regulator [Evansella caseinilytica]
MSGSEGKYNIKAASKILGIQPGTLRAWERRYRIIEPLRNQAGHRLYTEEHLAKLHWLITKVKRGFTIGQAVEILEQEDISGVSHQGNDQLLLIKNDLLRRLINLEENKSKQLVDQAFAMFAVEKVVIDILADILTEAERLWERGEISTVREKFITSFVRTRIGMVFQYLPVEPSLPKAMCACAPQEKQEIGSLLLTLCLKSCGFETIYLGRNIRENELLQTLMELKPKIFLLSCTKPDDLEEAVKLVQAITLQLPETAAGIGGQAVESAPETIADTGRKFFIGSTEEDWKGWLRSVQKKSNQIH